MKFEVHDVSIIRWLEKKLGSRTDSFEETVGCPVTRVTITFCDATIAASPRKGFQWPVPGLGKTRREEGEDSHHYQTFSGL